MISLYGIWVLVLLFVIASGQKKTETERKKVYVHIGPSKTGTTHIQDVMARLKDKLYGKKICWPSIGSRHGKIFSQLADALDKNDVAIVTKFRANINKCLKDGLTVIISSEHFHYMEHLETFYNFFKDYKLQIIAFHREFISKLYSDYTQHQKFVTVPSRFGPYLSSGLSGSFLSPDNGNNRFEIRKFEAMFGKENMTFVDYDGAMAAGKDIAFVILCDILGAFCDELPSVARSKSNTRPEMVPYNILTMIDELVGVVGCKICTIKKASLPDFVKALAAVTDVKVDLVQLPGLWPLSEYESLSYRKEYGDRMMYSNHTATMEVAQSFSVMELDEQAFYNSKQNTKWLRSQVVKLYADGQLCDCSPNTKSLIQALSSSA